MAKTIHDCFDLLYSMRFSWKKNDSRLDVIHALPLPSRMSEIDQELHMDYEFQRHNKAKQLLLKIFHFSNFSVYESE